MNFASVMRQRAFINSLHQGTVFRLKGEQPFPSDKYHIFVVLNYDPQTEEILYLVNGTSQISKSYDRLDRIGVDPNTTTVCMLPGDHSFITKDTIFDCNTVHSLRLSDIDFKNDAVKSITSDALSPEDVTKFIEATLASPVVPPHIKRLLKPQN